MTAIREELKTNQSILETIEQTLTQELSILDKEQSLVSAIDMFYEGTWDLLITTLPKKLRSEDLLKIGNVNQLISRINENIKSRESYRINNLAMSNYSSRLRKYDEGIISTIGTLKPLLQEIETVLKT